MQAPSDATGFSIAALGARDWLFIALGIVTAGYLVVLARAYKTLRHLRCQLRREFLRYAWHRLVRDHDVGFRHFKMVPDEQIPGTLNVGYVIPTVVQALSTRNSSLSMPRP